jgi:SAM-dependent methyltransferase
MTTVETVTGRTREYYELGHSDWELERLKRQATLLDPITRVFYREAGIAEGMRVLDIGCGAGCAALVLAGLVGESGAVIGIDRAPAAVASAVERVRKLGKRNISFCVAEVGEIENESFDAVAGRYVLLFNPERAEMVKVARRLTRSGGVIVFHEPDFSHIKGHPSNPPAPLYDRAMGLIVETLSGCGSNPYMALGLYRAFTKAGLEPTLALRATITGPTDLYGPIDRQTEVLVSMGPVMREFGLVELAEIEDLASVQARAKEEARALGSVIIGPLEIGAWARVP